MILDSKLLLWQILTFNLHTLHLIAKLTISLYCVSNAIKGLHLFVKLYFWSPLIGM